ncbi:unnamed protein product [Arctogadus glacialis]
MRLRLQGHKQLNPSGNVTQDQEMWLSYDAGTAQQCLQFQREMAERWDKETQRQDMRWQPVQSQMGSLRKESKDQQKVLSLRLRRLKTSNLWWAQLHSRGGRSRGRGWSQATVPRLRKRTTLNSTSQHLSSWQ